MFKATMSCVSTWMGDRLGIHDVLDFSPFCFWYFIIILIQFFLKKEIFLGGGFGRWVRLFEQRTQTSGTFLTCCCDACLDSICLVGK
jgi:hypothetical protein